MADINQLQTVFFNVIDEFNASRESSERLEKDIDTVLFGLGGILSSIDLVRLIVDFEEELQATFDVDLTLANENAMSRSNSPFRTVGSLLEYAGELLQ